MKQYGEQPWKKNAVDKREYVSYDYTKRDLNCNDLNKQKTKEKKEWIYSSYNRPTLLFSMYCW